MSNSKTAERNEYLSHRLIQVCSLVCEIRCEDIVNIPTNVVPRIVLCVKHCKHGGNVKF